MSFKFLVTGASGFIAGHTIERLLGHGHEVIGTVRNISDPEKFRHLNLLPGASQRLRLLSADLADPDAFDGMLDVDFVIHMANPMDIHAENPRQRLLEPAIRGVDTLLRNASQNKRVRRVVLTSSVAAMMDHPTSKPVTEKHWNTKSTLRRNPYAFAKTQAEKAAWQYVESHHPSYDLVTINPSLVLGPSHSQSVSVSNKVMLDIVQGKVPFLVPLSWGIVDVRDVADAHISAALTPGAHGRYICAGETMSMRGVLKIMRRLGHGQKLPSLDFGDSVGWGLGMAASLFQSKRVRSYLWSNLGRVPQFKRRKIREDLNVSFRTAEHSLVDTLKDFEKWGFIEEHRSQLGAQREVVVRSD